MPGAVRVCFEEVVWRSSAGAPASRTEARISSTKPDGHHVWCMVSRVLPRDGLWTGNPHGARRVKHSRSGALRAPTDQMRARLEGIRVYDALRPGRHPGARRLTSQRR